MIVIGSALTTGIPRGAVEDMLERECPVIELNIESQIDKGNNLQVLGPAEETVPQLIKAYLDLKNVENEPEELPAPKPESQDKLCVPTKPKL